MRVHATCAGGKAEWRRRELIAERSEAQFGCPVIYACTRREIQTPYVKVWSFRLLPAAVSVPSSAGLDVCATAVYDPAP